MRHPIDAMALKYVHLCMAYGLLHSIPHAYSLKQPLNGDMTGDPLLTDRVGCCMIGAGAAPVFWPLFLYEDARAIERLIRRGGVRD